MLEGFRKAQRMAYDAAEEVAGRLVPGTSEKQAARALGDALAARGVSRYFHRPFAWFGDRSRFAGFARLSPRFFPSERRLEEGMVGILDVAPIVDGYTADIGYTFRCGSGDDRLARALETLREIRALIPRHVERGDTMRSIYVRVERLLGERGYENCHARYPFGVLGHRVGKAGERRPETPVAGFGLSSLIELLGGELAARLPWRTGLTPMWTNGEAANQPPAPGLWALEPHLGTDGFGAKFEELLVVEPGRAYWLADDTPLARA